LLEAETNKYCPGGYDFGAISNLITWVLNFFLSVAQYPNPRTLNPELRIRIRIQEVNFYGSGKTGFYLENFVTIEKDIL
jgi:hypothetical protein